MGINFNIAEFKLGAVDPSQIPNRPIPQFAFIGRSNVGKSSLINALTRNKSLAKTSKTPGRTRQLNFFEIKDKLYLVDLPGYGYARASRSEAEQWTQLAINYLTSCGDLKRIFLLVDSRHGFKASDIQTIEFLNGHAISTFQIIFTKCDKLKKKDIATLEQSLADLCTENSMLLEDAIYTSSIKRDGIKSVQKTIEEAF